MVAKLKSGINIGAEQIAAAKLHKLIEGPNSPTDKTVILTAKFGLIDMLAAAGLIQISTTEPTDTTRPWMDITLNLLRIHDGIDWQPEGRGIVLNNNSGTGLFEGDIVVVDLNADKSFNRTTLENNTRVIGIMAETVLDGTKGVILTHGRAKVNFNNTFGSGTFYIGTSIGSGRAKANVSSVTGVIGYTFGPISDTSLVDSWLYGQPVIQ